MANPLIVIVGAGPGIGASVARRFGRDGYDVALVARDEGKLAEFGGELQAAGITTGWAAADVTDAPALEAALERFIAHTGRIDVLHHNAVRFRAAQAHELTADDLLADLAVGTASLATALRACVPTMRAQGHGTVLATGSGAADSPSPGAASLGVQKAALRSFVQAAARDLGDVGIHVATVTVRGVLQEGSPFAPDVVADVLADLAAESAGPRKAWRTVVDLTAHGTVAVV